jgi:hypothetical protein
MPDLLFHEDFSVASRNGPLSLETALPLRFGNLGLQTYLGELRSLWTDGGSQRVRSDLPTSAHMTAGMS